MAARKKVLMAASGDLRQSANETCWPAQEAMEKQVVAALNAFNVEVERAHPYDPALRHGFIASQKQGLEVFSKVDPDLPIVVAEAVWQYSNHVLPGLIGHRGPILTVANWSGQWPGLVGMLNLNGSLTKAGVPYSTLWSETFTDEPFKKKLNRWLTEGRVTHDVSHVHAFDPAAAPSRARALAKEIAADFRRRKAIMGIFDEGCMGMYNAIIPDELLQPLGVFKERLSQSTLYASMREVSDAEALDIRRWLDGKGMRFHTGPNPETDLTDEQILEQCKMYIAALRLADEFGCDAIGIQYQQGLKDLTPASDLAEGLLNNVDRPPVRAAGNGRVLFEGAALPHFNEVDECAGLDALATNRIWTELGYEPECTLHDVRYGERYHVNGGPSGPGEFVWLFEISGAVPPAHLMGGYAGAVSERQPPMYFRLGGGSIKGVSKPGEIVWSRIFVDGRLKADLGRGRAIALPL